MRNTQLDRAGARSACRVWGALRAGAAGQPRGSRPAAGWLAAWLGWGLLASTWCAGAVLDWSSVAWTAGDLDGNGPYTVGTYQVTVTVAYAGDGNIDSSDGSLLYPQIQSWSSLSGDALALWMDCATDSGSRNYVTVDVSLSQPVTGVSFTLADIDAGSSSRNDDRYDGWQDVVVVSAFQGSTRQPVSGTAVNASPSFAFDSDGNSYSSSALDLSVYATNGNIQGNDTRGDLVVHITDPVDRIRILYAPGGKGGRDEDSVPYGGPNDPEGQRVLLGDITLPGSPGRDPWPEVPEPATALLLLGAGAVLAAGRGRRQNA